MRHIRIRAQHIRPGDILAAEGQLFTVRIVTERGHGVLELVLESVAGPLTSRLRTTTEVTRLERAS